MTGRSINTDDERSRVVDCARRLARLAHAEDVGRGDITAGLLPPQGTGRFHVVVRAAGVFAGREIVEPVLKVFGGEVGCTWLETGQDGAAIDAPPSPVAELAGPVRSILTVERTLLNFLQRLSGIATATQAYVTAVQGTAAAILDTRKTTPGWRALEKYAVRCGGGTNHRFGLHDAIMIKDNHLGDVPVERTAGAVFEMLNRLEHLDPPPKFIEVEADTLAQAEQLMDVVGVNRILLDNFGSDDLRRAVELRNARNLQSKVLLEASGGVTLETVRAIAETGVDEISVGAITHSAMALDIALDRVVE